MLVQGVSGDQYALGYFGLAYYVENKGKLKDVQIDGGKGCVTPDQKTVEGGTYTPLSRPLFIYVKKAEAAKPEIKAFVDFYIKNASKLSAEVGYVKFPDKFYTAVTTRWTNLKVGSMYQPGSSRRYHPGAIVDRASVAHKLRSKKARGGSEKSGPPSSH